jgi:hypothetical protein
MVYNLVSIKRVIAKVYADLGFNEENIPVSDLISWASEALEKIRAIPMYTHKVTGKDNIPLLQIENYQARLPLDCHSVIQVAYTQDQYGTSGFYPMKYSTGSFEGRNNLITASNTLSSDVSTYTTASADVITLVMELYDYTYEEAVTWLNSNADKESTLKTLLDETTSLSNTTTNQYQLEYKIVPGYIKTNQETGYLMVGYHAIPTDEDGYPMIPDDESFMEALYWYINMKLKYIEWSNGRIRDAIYYHTENKWRFYAKQAYGRALMPASADELESFKNVWNRLIPNINAGDSFYQYTDNQEMIKTFA